MPSQKPNRQRSSSKELVSHGLSKVERSPRSKRSSQAIVVQLSRFPDIHPAGLELKIVHKDGSGNEHESSADERKDELLAISASLMNDILCAGLHAPIVSPRKKMGLSESVAIDFYINAFAPSWTKTLVTMTANLDTPNPCLSTFLPAAMQNEELFHAIVAISFSTIESLSSLEVDGDILKKPSTKILYHRLWALKFLQEKLTLPNHDVDDAMLLTAIILIGIDGQLGDTKAFDAHCRGLRQMIQTRRGLNGSGIDALLQRFFEQNDYDWALETGQEVALILPEAHHTASITSVPPAFTKLILSFHSRSILLEIIGRISSWIESVDLVWQGTALPHHREFLLSYTLFQEVSEALACLKYASNFKGQSFEVSLCLALVIILNNFYGDAKGRYLSWYQAIRARLTTTLLAHFESPPEDPSVRDCLIWISMVAVESWRSGYFLQSPGRHLMQEVLSRYEETGNWQTLEDILKNFLWYDPHGAMMEACWRECTIAPGLIEVNDAVLLECTETSTSKV